MKIFTLTVALFFALSTLNTFAQSLVGVWELVEKADNGFGNDRVIKLYTDNYFTITHYEENPAEFYSTKGGIYEHEGGKYSETMEFNTNEPELIGEKITYTLQRNGNQLLITDKGKEEVWKKIDVPHTEITGVWQISERMGKDNKMSTMPDGPRKTIKIFSGDRFQWAAINTETKEFFGTGGGTFSIEDGQYTENIEFFSRDNNKAGLSLTFNQKLSDNATSWLHTGESTTGNPVKEIWTKVE